MKPEDQFEYLLIAGKLLFIVAFLSLSLVNGYQKYVQENPRKFIIDCVVSGIMGAVAFMLIAKMRGRSDLALSVGISSFLLFFMINVLFEFSGFNSLSDPKSTLTGNEQNEKNTFKKPMVWAPVIGILIFYLILFFRAMGKVKQPFPPTMAKETLIFALTSGIMGAYVAYHHNTPLGMNIGTTTAMTIMWAILYVILQRGGFIDHVLFPDAPPCIK